MYVVLYQNVKNLIVQDWVPWWDMYNRMDIRIQQLSGLCIAIKLVLGTQTESTASTPGA